MGNHRATRVSRAATPDIASAPSVAGKRRAVKPPSQRGGLLRKLPSPPVLLGVAALSVSATGAVSAGAADNVSAEPSHVARTTGANAMNGTTVVASTSMERERARTVSRDSRRDALENATIEKVQQATDAQARERNAEIQRLAQSAEKQAAKIALNLWQRPVDNYRLTARFGQSSGLWANTHTGLDFAAPSGTPVVAVASGTVTEAASAGAYGNRLVLTTAEGDEIWFCHLTAFAASPGEEVRAGEVIGYVGSTGNSTGPHLHLEVRPGAGDPVDPYAALVAHGVAL
jgi:murein DD-endopeptidase MepM/ murein hydrolase activator NlpD